jgi:hypothetical protein
LEALRAHELRHLGAPAEFVDEGLVEPGFVDLQRRVGEQPVAVETFDVVALVGRAVTPDVHLVLLHRRHQHRASDRAAQRRGVEIGHAGGRDVERAALQRRNAFGDELGAAVDQARLLGAVVQRLARNLVVVGLVGLAQVGGVGVGHGALAAHPDQRGAGVQPAGERDADLLAEGKVLQDGGHGRSWIWGRWG